MKRRKLKQNTLEQYYRRQANELGMTAFFSTLFISTAREREALYAMMRPPLLTTTLSKLCSALHKMCCLDSAVPVAGMNKREKKKEKNIFARRLRALKRGKTNETKHK